MRKGQRPARHVRRVHTRRGVKPALVNPSISKRTTNKQYRRMMRRMAPFADADGDGVKNIDDCRPFNKKRQDEQVSDEIKRKQKEAEERREREAREEELAEERRKKQLDLEFYEKQKQLQHETDIKTAKKKAEIERKEEMRREAERKKEKEERDRKERVEKYGELQVAIAEHRKKRFGY